MPHLSPLYWCLCPLIFWLMMLAICSSMWWHQAPKFPALSNSLKMPTPQKWTWKCSMN